MVSSRGSYVQGSYFQLSYIQGSYIEGGYMRGLLHLGDLTLRSSYIQVLNQYCYNSDDLYKFLSLCLLLHFILVPAFLSH